MRTILSGVADGCQTRSAILGPVLVVNRFRVPEQEAPAFRDDLERARLALAARPGHVEGRVGRNVDDPGLWALIRRWEHVGAYRSALSAYDVKLHAVPVLGRAVEEPSAFEPVEPGADLNVREPVVRLRPRPHAHVRPAASRPDLCEVSHSVAKPPATTLDHVVSLCKRRGFVYPCGEIYGGTRSAWDYGPLGVELKENIKRQWWKSMVTAREDVVGLDSSVILPTRTWEASGHLKTFSDPLTECQSCHKRYREDHLQEDYAPKKGIDDPDTVDINETVACPNCGTRGAWTPPRAFNMMLKTYLGVIEDESGRTTCDPRPPRASSSIRQRRDLAAAKLPFGIAQMGKSFRNEITPGNFIFRSREFEQMEMEFFVKPGEDEELHQYWIDERPGGTRPRHDPDNLRLREHPRTSSATTPSAPSTSSTASASRPRLRGARGHRQPHRLRPHAAQRVSGQDLSYFDQASSERYMPYVIEPAAGLHPLAAGVPDRRLPGGRGAQHQGRGRQAHGAAPRPAPRADQGRRAAADPQRGPRPKAKALADELRQQLEHRVRRLRRDRPPLPPPGRDRHALLRDGRLRHPRRQRRHGARARHQRQERISLEGIFDLLRGAFPRLLSSWIGGSHAALATLTNTGRCVSRARARYSNAVRLRR